MVHLYYSISRSVGRNYGELKNGANCEMAMDLVPRPRYRMFLSRDEKRHLY